MRVADDGRTQHECWPTGVHIAIEALFYRQLAFAMTFMTLIVAVSSGYRRLASGYSFSCCFRPWSIRRFNLNACGLAHETLVDQAGSLALGKDASRLAINEQSVIVRTNERYLNKNIYTLVAIQVCVAFFSFIIFSRLKL